MRSNRDLIRRSRARARALERERELEVINERRYKSRPLVSAGRLFFAPIASVMKAPLAPIPDALEIGIWGSDPFGCATNGIDDSDDDRTIGIGEREGQSTVTMMEIKRDQMVKYRRKSRKQISSHRGDILKMRDGTDKRVITARRKPFTYARDALAVLETLTFPPNHPSE